MGDPKQLIIIAILIVSANPALVLDILNPLGTVQNVANTAAALTQPVVEVAANVAGNFLPNTVDLLSSSLLSITGNIPNLLSDTAYKLNSFSDVEKFSLGLSNEDVKLDFQQLSHKYGYPTESHEVLTEDGYFLTLFRIPRTGPVVFLMHGLLGSAEDFVVAGRECSLAFLLAEDGYDVWLGNARGNKYSRQHETLSPLDADFWDFSWHEIGCYDLPAMIDYVLDETGRKSLKYIGHSQGTTIFFVMASERPEYNAKIALMVALSPVAYMSHITSPMVRLLSPNNVLVHQILKLVGAHEFLPQNIFTTALKHLLCGTGPTAEIFCSNVLFLIAGFDYVQLNVSQLPVIYGHVPSGAATKQLVHYGQGVQSGEFRQFDYGRTENLWRYGSHSPPTYNLGNVVANVSLFYSEADWLSAPADVDVLYNKLPNAFDIHNIPFHPFNHLDFIWAKDYKSLIYARLRKLLKIF